MSPVNVDLGYTHLEIGDHYVIARTAEGVDVGLKEHQWVMETISKHTEFPVVLVLDEVNSYSVKLETLLALRNEKRIGNTGVICYRSSTFITYNLGSKLARRPVNFFVSRMEATDWARNRVQDGLVV